MKHISLAASLLVLSMGLFGQNERKGSIYYFLNIQSDDNQYQCGDHASIYPCYTEQDTLLIPESDLSDSLTLKVVYHDDFSYALPDYLSWTKDGDSIPQEEMTINRTYEWIEFIITVAQPGTYSIDSTNCSGCNWVTFLPESFPTVKVMVPSTTEKKPSPSYDSLPPDINVYPNPARGEVNINLVNLTKQVEGNLFSMSGRLVSQFQLASGTRIYQLHNLDPGAYLLILQSGEFVARKKVVVVE